MNLSFPREKAVCGITVKKLRLGKFIELIEHLAAIPGELLEELFPGRTADGVLTLLINAESGELSDMLRRAAVVIPREIVALTANMIGVNEETLLENDEIGPTELLMLIEAFIEVNNLRNFMLPARNIAETLRKTPVSSGRSS